MNILVNDTHNHTESYELMLWVHDQDETTAEDAVWCVKVGDEKRYFEASINEEVWILVDLAVHCYDETI
jgi:hypothetical protein